VLGARAIPIFCRRKKPVVTASGRVRVIVTVALSRVIGFTIVAVLIFMIVSMIIGAHRTVLVRPVLCAHQRRGQPGHRKHG
jgi:large-conductance mechanosensitive channel